MDGSGSLPGQGAVMSSPPFEPVPDWGRVPAPVRDGLKWSLRWATALLASGMASWIAGRLAGQAAIALGPLAHRGEIAVVERLLYALFALPGLLGLAAVGLYGAVAALRERPWARRAGRSAQASVPSVDPEPPEVRVEVAAVDELAEQSVGRTATTAFFWVLLRGLVGAALLAPAAFATTFGADRVAAGLFGLGWAVWAVTALGAASALSEEAGPVEAFSPRILARSLAGGPTVWTAAGLEGGLAVLLWSVDGLPGPVAWFALRSAGLLVGARVVGLVSPGTR